MDGAIPLAQFKNLAVHQFDGRRMMAKCHQVPLEALHQVVAMPAHHHHLLGRQRVETHREFRDKGQRPLTSCQQLAKVDTPIAVGNEVLYHLVNSIPAAASVQFLVRVVVSNQAYGLLVVGKADELRIDTLYQRLMRRFLPEPLAKPLL